MSENILIEKRGHLAIITLNKAESLNALSAAYYKEIMGVFSEIANDRDIFVAILTGSGKAFVAGADIKEMINLTPVDMIEWVKLGSDLNLQIERMRIPIIAAVNGYALGGGCELALACDIRVASEKAKFGVPEVGIGVTCGAGGTQRLPRIVGEGVAKELLFTGKTINAAEAYRIGLVNKVVAPEQLLDECITLAESILKNAQLAVQQVKLNVNMGMQTDIVTALTIEELGFCVMNATEDKNIGMNAFVNKGEKNFKFK